MYILRVGHVLVRTLVTPGGLAAPGWSGASDAPAEMGVSSTGGQFVTSLQEASAPQESTLQVGEERRGGE